ncbi:MAG: hypothetical protein JWN01_1297 [Patescibacteria group bacterium]|nr:hypothetical protein [Patescibacteria group bacterium]
MDYRDYAKKFHLPEGFAAPSELTADGFVARPLTRADLKPDLAAVNSSIAIIQQTRGGSWPSEELTEDFDFLDLAWHEREFRDASSFAYVVYDTKRAYVGCFYLYPLGHRTELSEAVLEYDVDASWWVSQEAYNNGLYVKLYAALQIWLKDNFPFKKVYFSNKEIPS